MTTAVDDAVFSAAASIVTDEEPVTSPSTCTVVCPLTVANGNIRAIATAPPAAPPGALAVAWFQASAVTSTAPEVLTLPLARMAASVLRATVEIATVTPIAAAAPVVTLTVSALRFSW